MPARDRKIRTRVTDHRREMLSAIRDRGARRRAGGGRAKGAGCVYLVRFDSRERDDAFRRFERDANAVILHASPGDVVHLAIHSPGGSVTAYANAANHVARMRAAGLGVVAFVDEVAASGGYMMASACDEVRANPLAFVGSVGVVAHMPIVSGALARAGVDVRVYTAGEMKRTVTPFDVPTPEREKAFEAKLADVHAAFRAHVRATRPGATEADLNGDYFMARDVLGRLVDRIQDHESALLEALGSGAAIRAVRSETARRRGLRGLLGLDAALETALEAAGGRVAERLLGAAAFPPIG